jgi:hypothetical protein
MIENKRRRNQKYLCVIIKFLSRGAQYLLIIASFLNHYILNFLLRIFVLFFSKDKDIENNLTRHKRRNY